MQESNPRGPELVLLYYPQASLLFSDTRNLRLGQLAKHMYVHELMLYISVYIHCSYREEVNYAGQMCECVGMRHKFICAVLMNKISGCGLRMYIDM